jgi:hypothetical protein
MNKAYTFFILLKLLALHHISYAQLVKNDVEYFGFTGQVKSAKIYQHPVESSPPRVLYFDKQGMLIKQTIQGETHKYAVTSSKQSVERHIIKDNNTTLSDQTIVAAWYNYDEQGRCISRKHDSHKSGLKYSALSAKYNKQGKLVEYKVIGKNKRKLRKITYRYNSQGQKVKSIWKVWGGKVMINKTLFKYNKKGDLIEEKTYLSNRLLSKDVFKYTPNGHVKEGKFYDYQGETISKTISKYDQDGKILESIEDSKPVKNYRTTYTYDKHDNWLMRTDHFKGQKRIASKRVIEYY